MSDSNETGTGDPGTQAVDDAATSMETAPAGTPSEQATTQEQPADSQPSNRTTDPQPDDAAGKPAPAQAQPDPATANQWESDQNPYRKRFNDTLSHAQRLYQERQQYDRQIQEYKTKLSDFESKAKQQAEISKLNPWNKGHPEHARYKAISERAQNFQRLRAKADTPEKQAMLREMMASEFTPEDAAMIEQAENDRKNVLSDFTSDPRGFIAQNVQETVQQEIQKFSQFMEARQQVSGMISDPTNTKLIEAYAPQMHRIMDPSVSASEKAFEHAKLLAEVEALRAQVGQKFEQVAAEEARNVARGGGKRNAQQRGSSGEIQDPIAYLTKKGIPPGHPNHARELLRLNNDA